MGHQDVLEPTVEEVRLFMRRILSDLQALEILLEKGLFERGVRRIGAEQELFLIDDRFGPARVAVEVLETLGHPQFTTELALFNLEVNLHPVVFGGRCLSQLEEELDQLLLRARDAARAHHADILLAGILPTLQVSDLGLDSMTPHPRYHVLNQAMTRLRGGAFHTLIKGMDELNISHDNVMMESCNTSFQIHFQVAPDEFARLYNTAQVVTAPVLAAAVNSPVFLGQRLWHETRIALFQHAVDGRSPAHVARGLRPRVTFGEGWVRESVVEIFREDIARFRAVLSAPDTASSLDAVRRGEIPSLSALRLHNGTVYRWNRPCYGITDGVPHLRIENRALPAGPTVVDEVANAAFFFGLMSSLVEEFRDIQSVFAFDDARNNFLKAARLGLGAQLRWTSGETHAAPALIRERLLPMAREGLREAKIDPGDIDRYLGILEARVTTARTGARWVFDSLQEMGTAGTRDRRLRTLVAAMQKRQTDGSPVHTWEPATLAEAGGWRAGYRTVGQFMTTDLFTVRTGDVIDLAASLMDWEHIRHVPVEDDDGKLVGLVSHRALLRLLARGGGDQATPVSVGDIMKTTVVSIPPETTALEAIACMKKHRVGCLPVVSGERLVGIVTVSDFLDATAEIFEKEMREEGSS